MSDHERIPPLAQTSFSVDDLAELAKEGLVFDEVITTDSLPDEAKQLLPEGLLRILQADGAWVMFKQVDLDNRGNL